MSLTDLLSSSRSSSIGRVPVFRPALNGETFDIRVSEASITLSENQHDSATLSCTSPTLKDTAGMLDSTLSFFWGQAPKTDLFNGYIVSVGQENLISGSLSFTLTVAGATKLMQTGKPRFWSNKSIPSAVKDLAYVSGLGFIGHDHTFLWKMLGQTGDTDWKTAVDFAVRLGWRIYTRYGVVMCYNPLTLYRDWGSYSRLISGTYRDRDLDPTTERRLLDFQPTEEADMSIYQQGIRVFYFGGGDEIQHADQKGTYDVYRFRPNFLIRNAEEARIHVDADDNNPDQWKQSATASVVGDANLYPGMNVDILTSNPRFYRDQYNGRWLIRNVQHHLDNQSFQTQLRLARPDSRTNIYTGAYDAFWTKAGKSRPTLSLSNKRWVSSWTNPTAAGGQT